MAKMAKLNISTSLNSKNTAVVYGLREVESGKVGYEIILPEVSPLSDVELKDIQSNFLSALGASGKEGRVTKFIYPRKSGNLLVIFVGLGKYSTKKPTDKDIERIRRAAGVAVRNSDKNQGLAIAFPSFSSAAITASAEGALLGNYVFHDFKNESKPKGAAQLNEITILAKTTPSESKKIVEWAGINSASTYLARDLINTPPNALYPATFVDYASKAITGLGITKKVYTEKELKDQGFGGLVGVGQGSIHPPRLLHLHYAPKGAARSAAKSAKGAKQSNKDSNAKNQMKHVALVGKGITFDSGGLALKPANGMEDMKSDMSGAAAVVATIIAAAKLNLPVVIDAWAALAENMPSDTAQRPSDIITIYGGTTVEVINPDAEGRLVLADALVKAQEVATNLDAIIDVATLTGAQGVALGSRVSAAMGNDEALSESFLSAAATSGELFWPMPLPQDLRPSLDSPVADIANMGERMGGMLVAGLFLQHFIKADQPWLHLDIASPALNTGEPWGYTPVGGTGIAVRALIQYLAS
jgi:leucyl aminopeptidase